MGAVTIPWDPEAVTRKVMFTGGAQPDGMQLSLEIESPSVIEPKSGETTVALTIAPNMVKDAVAFTE